MMLKKLFKGVTLFTAAMIIAVVIVAAGLSACSTRGGTGERDTSSISRRSSGPGAAEAIGMPDLVELADEKWNLNEDTVGWLQLPGTDIDDVVLWKEGDNDFYLRRNFEKRTYFNGVYYADKRSTFGEGYLEDLGRNTVIYGHSMSDSKDDVKFGPIRNYLDEEFAKTHPYIYFSTTKENLVWEVVAVFYTNWKVPYNRNDLTYNEFKDMYKEVTDRSVFTYGHKLKESDKFITLSTCVYSLPGKGTLDYPNEYRFGIMARLVGSKEKLKKEADFVKNPNIKSA